MNLLDSIVSEARDWVGTPFFPHGKLKGIGIDCVQFPLAVFKAVGAVPDSIEFPRYRIDGWHDKSSRNIVREWLTGEGVQWFDESPKPCFGGLVTLRIGEIEHHVGIVINASDDKTEFVHCIRHSGVIVSNARDSTWGKRISSYWRYKT